MKVKMSKHERSVVLFDDSQFEQHTDSTELLEVHTE